LPELPTGTVTFLFTDLETSTRLCEQHAAAMPEVITRHDAILHEAITAHRPAPRRHARLNALRGCAARQPLNSSVDRG
jgi:class 3 adenylate cyclase